MGHDHDSGWDRPKGTKPPKKTVSPVRVTENSGNVFADLGLPNAEQELVKAQRNDGVEAFRNSVSKLWAPLRIPWASARPRPCFTTRGYQYPAAKTLRHIRLPGYMPLSVALLPSATLIDDAVPTPVPNT